MPCGNEGLVACLHVGNGDETYCPTFQWNETAVSNDQWGCMNNSIAVIEQLTNLHSVVAVIFHTHLFYTPICRGLEMCTRRKRIVAVDIVIIKYDLFKQPPPPS